MEKMTAGEIAQLAEGDLSGVFKTDGIIDAVIIDSRQVKNHSLFVAIRGDTNDGHNYVEQVVAKAGNYALVNNDFPLDLPNLIRVKDTTLALGTIAANYRKKFNLPIAAITGSNGKTTVKEMLKCICDREFGKEHVLATSGNLNNHLGLPLTILQLSEKHKVAILEMGMNHSGELDYLSKAGKPTVAAINNVMFAHAGHFNSIEDIARAKGEIYHGITSDGTACLDLSSEYMRMWQGEDIQCNIFPYGTKETNCYLRDVEDGVGYYVTPLGEIEVSLRILGQHNYYNGLTAIALAINLGCSLKSIKTGLESYSGYKGRLELKNAFNGALIIDDTYNANPDSVKAALNAIQGLPRPYWFIFADLKELGIHELSFHQEIGEYADASNIDMLLTVGDLAAHAAKFYKRDKIHFATNQDIVKYCLTNLPKNATLLIKGSNSMRLGEIAEELSLGKKIL